MSIKINVETESISGKECGCAFKVVINVTVDKVSDLEFIFEILDASTTCKFTDPNAYDGGAKTRMPRHAKRIRSNKHFLLTIECTKNPHLVIGVTAKEKQGNESNEDKIHVSLTKCGR
ncbi:MAG: hypothetical protein KAW12_04380 [Candidatus Aminicenantes bacterium]|nr:hypothetical protein [Candidatus Aminicenantes bacterium]